VADRYTAKIEVLKFDSVKVLETASSPTVANITAHGLNNGDFFVNLTQAENPPVRYGGETARRKVQNATTNSFGMYTVSGQTAGDIIVAYSFQDVTDRLLDGTLKMEIQTQGENSAEFALKATYTAPGYFLGIDGFDDAYWFKLVFEYNIPRKTWVEKTAGTYYRSRNCAETIDNLAYNMMGYDGVVVRGSIPYTEAYNRETDTWEAKQSASSARTSPMALSLNDLIYVYGGYNSTSGYFGNTDSYDPGTDSWTALTSGSARADGEAVNLCDIMFEAYTTISGGFTNDDVFYIPYNDSWVTFMVDHNPPNRTLARSGFTIDGFKGSIIGGTTDYYTDPTYATDNHTMINFACKVYTEKQAIPDALQEAFVSQYEQYAILAGGMGGYSSIDPRAFFDAAYYWNSASDTWSAIDNIPYAVATGMGCSF